MRLIRKTYFDRKNDADFVRRTPFLPDAKLHLGHARIGYKLGKGGIVGVFPTIMLKCSQLSKFRVAAIGSGTAP
jgi:hypothetical protein